MIYYKASSRSKGYKVLVEQFGIKGMGTVEGDLKFLWGNNNMGQGTDALSHFKPVNTY